MNERKHTQGPLVASGNRLYMGAAMERREVAVATKADPAIRASAEANAARLALCWNTHDDLLAACEAALRTLKPMETNWATENVCNSLRAAIAKAKGGE